MCYFGPPPYAIKNIETGEIKQIKNNGIIGSTPHDFSVMQEGFYYVATTGCYYLYFDGQQEWNDRNGWGKPSDKYWQDTGGIHPQYAKYEFLYPSYDITDYFSKSLINNIKELPKL